jgi:MFS family permease
MIKKLFPVLALSFINTIGFSVLIPVLPFVVERYGGGPVTYGLLLSSYSVFQFIGSPLLGALSDTHGRKPVLMISHFGTFLGWLPESLPPSKRSHDPSMRLWKRANVLSRIAHYAQDRQVKTLFTVRTLFSIGFVAYVSIFIFHAIRFFHLNELQSSQFLLFTGSFLIVNQWFAVRRFVARFGEAATFSFGQAFMLAALVAMSFTHSLPLFVFFYYFLNLGVSLSMATFKSLLVRSVSERQRGEIMGIEESLVALVQAVVPALAGLVYASLGPASFVCFALLNVAVFLTIRRHSKGLVLKLAPQAASARGD